ncbi:MAG TPA: lipocalin-like domain-containing protein [Anaeromyxobacteraceae bacterium]|nr:lipocalin-like domain-containing protein [Anaeromyxobacteraceae bacterium]
MRCRRASSLAAVAAIAMAAGAPAAAEGFRPAQPGHAWTFPRDHWAARAYRNEWWYFTGNLVAVDEPSRALGFQLTFFRVGFLPEKQPLASAWATSGAVMAHAAITDVATGEHRFSEVLWREMPLLGGFGAYPDPVIAWAKPPPGTDGRWSLRWTGSGFELGMRDDGRDMAIALSASPRKPVALQGPGGFSRKSNAPGHASLYYSITRLDAEGTISVAGREWRVRGDAWMDREMGSSQLAPGQVGWDWWSLQLADGRDLMLYRLRRADGTVDFAYGTVVDADGTTRFLEPGGWESRATSTWRSPRTGAEYPAAWKITVPREKIDISVEPRVAAQENVARLAGGLFYWEGAVRVRDAGGNDAGQGYVELTGYGRGNRPPL